MPEGVYISSVEQGSAAEECGLQSGDIICSLDGEDIADMETFHDKIVACNPGTIKVTIVYYRNNNGNYEADCYSYAEGEAVISQIIQW